MEQKIEFFIKHKKVKKAQKKVDKLTHSLIKLLPEFNIEFVNKGGARSNTRPLDAALYDLHSDSKKIGFYEYELKKDIYQCNLDLTGIDIVKYETIMKTLKSKYPKYFVCNTEKLNQD